MKKQTRSNWQTIMLTTIGAIVLMFATSTVAFTQAAYKVGDKIEVISSTTWYKAQILEAKAGQYKIHYDGWSSTFDEWVKPDRIRAIDTRPPTESQKKWRDLDRWRDQFAIGEKVEFSTSGKADDFQICTVSENDPESVMRVKCDDSKRWTAGVNIVHAEGNIRSTEPGARRVPAVENESNRNEPLAATKPPKSSGGGLKAVEYACIGADGRMMIGLGFKVLSGNRFIDLDGKNPGTFVIAGDKVTFRGGHLDGITGRDLKDNRFTVASAAQCGPF